ncbi:MAG: hypothetical protein KBT04_03270, partial [Bacteroidales bacterium]|nr:hypothetical protein [Candidatus Colimorpha onthohippi]
MIIAVTTSCNNHGQTSDTTNTVNYTTIATPNFCADSAMAYVERQLNFGYRAPGYDAHNQCAKYLQQSMQQWCDTVITQQFNTTLWDNTTTQGQNIIASFNPQATNRVL